MISMTEIVALDSTKLVSLGKFVGNHLDKMVYNTVCLKSSYLWSRMFSIIVL